MIDILNRWTRAVVYHSDTAQTIAEAVLECQQRASEAGWRADLQGAYLRDADLQGADLQRADLRGANLMGADLRGAFLQRADLEGADLVGADLRGAYLVGAYLVDADLQGADLRGAYLQRAYLQGAYLQGAAGLLPNGILPLQIGGSRHWIIVRQPGYITIGCHHQPVAWWEEHYAAVGRAEGYTAEQVAEYRSYIDFCREWMKARGVLAVEEAA